MRREARDKFGLEAVQIVNRIAFAFLLEAPRHFGNLHRRDGAQKGHTESLDVFGCLD